MRDEFELFKRQVMEALMATQADVDALTQTVSAVQNEVATAVTDIQNEISQLQSGLDLGPLQAAVQGLQATADAVKALAPQPVVEPVVEPAPEPS